VSRGQQSAPTPPRAFLEDLDAIPFPAWDLVDVERYRNAWSEAHGRLSWNVVTSRGCPYRCNWCAKPTFGTRYAQRSPGNVAEELRYLKETVRPEHVWFADDIFGLTASWIEAFAREVNARDARIPFTMQSRVNLMRPDVVAALADAGAEEVWLGVESGSQEILDAMDKGTKLDQIRLATRTLRAHGIRSCWFIQLGYLGEDWEDVLQTRDLIREGRPDDIGVSVSYPLPGTEFYEIVKRQLGAKTNWDDSDDLAMLFHGTYETRFYKMIRSLLHDEVDAGPEIDPAAQQQFDDRWADIERTEWQYRTVKASAASA
jgi:anaerobic magnesium-protoporphyrin IX monomethyl ester cyclase